MCVCLWDKKKSKNGEKSDAFFRWIKCALHRHRIFFIHSSFVARFAFVGRTPPPREKKKDDDDHDDGVSSSIAAAALRDVPLFRRRRKRFFEEARV